MSRWIQPASVFALIFAAVLALQWLDGAYQNELGGHSDEAAHYVTGRMAADYVTTSLGRNPKEFAETYYVRYPMVAIGHWPPLFYVVMTAWFVLFGAAYGSALVLMAVIASLFAFAVGLMVWREHGPMVALLVGLLAVAMPFVHVTTALVMADSLTALLSTLAIIAYARYLDRPDLRWAVAFGLLASLAILTKGSAAALGLMVPLTVVLGNRWASLKRLSFWLPALIVVILCGPWYIATRDMARNGLLASDSSAAESLIGALVTPVREGVRSFGVVISVVAVVGVVLTVARRREADGQRLVLASFLPAFLLLHAFTLSGIFETRYLILVVPAVFVFFLDGANWLLARVGGAKAQQYSRAAVSLVLAGLIVVWVTTFDFPSKSCRGYAEVVELVLSKPELRKKPMLICSDGSGEGMFVAETLRQDTERACLVLRSSKVLASSQWMGRDYEAFVQTPADVAGLLQRLHVGAIVVDASVSEQRRKLHDRLLVESLDSKSSAYHLLKSSSVIRGKHRFADGLRVYAANDSADEGPADIEIDMRHTFGRPIKLRVGPAGLEIRH